MPDEALTLESLQRDLLLPELDSFLAAAPETAGRQAYVELRDAVRTLRVPHDLAERLAVIIELLLTSGKARRTYGPAADLSLWGLFQKTPRGAAMRESLANLNAALKAFEGQTLEFVSVAARAPGAYSITLRSAALQVVVRFDAAGARVETVEIGAE